MSSLAALKFCFKTCVAMKFVDDDDDDDGGGGGGGDDDDDDDVVRSSVCRLSV